MQGGDGPTPTAPTGAWGTLAPDATGPCRRPARRRLVNDLSKIQLYKKILLGVWIFAALSFLPPFAGMGIAPLGRNLFGLLLVIHAIECVVFLGTLRSTGRPLANELLKTLVFGVLHYREIKLEQGGSA